MTYCVALRLEAGMIFASDSRTNAGVDQVATFTKMRVYEKPDDRVLVTLTSGNLAMTQGVIDLLDRQARASEGTRTLWNVESLYDAAQLVGGALREMHQRDSDFLARSNIEAHAELIVGGQIAGERRERRADGGKLHGISWKVGRGNARILHQRHEQRIVPG
jgi:putative proteasome-type protease